MISILSSWFLEPISYPFMQRAILIALVTGVVCAMLSCFIVLKGWSLIGDAISHAVLPGLVVAVVTGIPMVIGAFAAGVLCTLTAGFVADNSRLKPDTVLGVVFSGMFGLGLVLFTLYAPGQHLTHILLGDLLGVTASDFKQVMWMAAAVVILISLSYRNLILFSFDAAFARSAGLNTRLMYYGFMLLLSLTIVVSLQAVGMILVIGMLITPGLTAQILCKRFNNMMFTAISVTVLAELIGTFVSYHLDVSTGPCIVLMQSLFFVFAYILSMLQNHAQKKQLLRSSMKNSSANQNMLGSN